MTRQSADAMTSFAGHFSLAPNELHITNVEDFFNLRRNPVTFSLIACIIAVYIILLGICIKLDQQDADKGQIIHLIDRVMLSRWRRDSGKVLARPLR